MSQTLHFTLGENLGEILLDIAQEAISKGDIDKAIATYRDSLIDFPEEYVKKLLKNECVLKTSEDGQTLDISYNKEDIENNVKNIQDWYQSFKLSDIYLNDIIKRIWEVKNSLSNRQVVAYNFNIKSLCVIYEAEINIAAKLIAGQNFANLHSNGENVWERVTENYENDKASKEECILYELVEYVKLIKELHNEYMHAYNFYKTLRYFDLIEHYVFIERIWERALKLLTEFYDETKGYYHPLCNEKLHILKEQIFEEVLSTKPGLEYQLYHILKKNPSDHYDAAWISPEGEFYGAIGETSEMLHYILAEKLAEKRLKDEIKESDLEAEQYLCDHSWIKLHGNEAYCYLAYDRKHGEETGRLFAPTKQQIEAICTYMDKWHNGKFYTEFVGLGSRFRQVDPYSTRDIIQMDELSLRKAFKI